MIALATQPMASVALRVAAPDDCEAVWRWSCAPDVRAWSRQPGEVAFGDHARWYAGRLGDARRPMWVIEEHFAPVGVLRLDPIAGPVAGGFTRISIALAAAARGRGIGRAAITAACRAWGRPIVAEIRADNLASRACFAACGFHSVVACDDLLTYHWDPET